MLKMFAGAFALASAFHAYGADERYIDEASSFHLYPFTVDRIKDYYGQRIKESDFACKLPETAAMRPPKGMDCRSWTATKVLYGGKIEMDAVVYGATTAGLVTSFYYIKSTDCAAALRDFLYVQSFVFQDGKAKAIGFQYGEDGLITRGHIKMDGQLPKSRGHKYLELEYTKGVCELTFGHAIKSQ